MTRTLLVLLVSNDEWLVRSLVSVLAPRGYAILRAYTGEQALERAAAAELDAVLISTSLDVDGGWLCRALLKRDLLAVSAPIMVFAAPHASREEKLALLNAGAWDVAGLPVDSEEFLLRLERSVQGKLEVDRVREHALIDHITGLYTREGAIHRGREVGAAAERSGRPMACVVVTTAEEPDSLPGLSTGEVVAIADRLRGATRRSDILARIGAGDFAIIAADTPPRGARILADRLREQASFLEAGAGRAVHAGVYAIADPRVVAVDPGDMIRHAASASRPGSANLMR